MAAGAEVEHIKVALHNVLRRRVQLAIFDNLAPSHLRIAVHPQGLQALLLQQSRLHYAFADGSRRFALFLRFQLAELHPAQVYLHIDSVHQRTGNLAFIAVNFRLFTGTAVHRITEEPTGAWILSCA